MKKLSIVLFLAYVLVLIKLLFFKVRLAFSTIDIAGNEKASFKTLYDGSNFIPLYRIYYYASGQEPYLVGMLNIFGNILLFVPMGFFLPYFFKRINSYKRLVLLAGFMSLCIEVLQLITATGEFDADDVLLNTVGALIGYFVFARTKHLFRKPPSNTDALE
ncbi:VanZ family protein [Flavisolibacter ginsenosidimutans]|uniref:VanZ family protein n=1 Tax=Flavisolibacter ginsenosidimutans TaxID=661481 RepID=A0A5B8UHL9_9BACT|nr:VanZ family protein [Flavisolibacter ginsenosidimutans]QEC55998.1 VanZ family protein [Flavisolibacter ginsenosidimutans]